MIASDDQIDAAELSCIGDKDLLVLVGSATCAFARRVEFFKEGNISPAISHSISELRIRTAWVMGSKPMAFQKLPLHLALRAP